MSRGGNQHSITRDRHDGPRAAVGLTPRARDVLAYVTEYPDASYREIGDAVGISSTARVSGRLAELERAGLIRRLLNRPRSIEVLGPEPSAKPVVKLPPKIIYLQLRGRID